MDYSVVTELIFAYASGDFSKKGEISERRDDLDMLIAGINMLGEELQTTTVSRDYFSSLYHAVSNMIIVLDEKGKIDDVNANFMIHSGMELDAIKGKYFSGLLAIDQMQGQQEEWDLEHLNGESLEFTARLANNEGLQIPVKVLISRIFKNKSEASGYLLILEDIRDKLERESLVLRTIVETQESERRRVADDLHDSLGQKLSAVKLYLNALGSVSDVPPTFKSSVRKAKQIVDESIQDLRDIIFDQMPITLDRFGLVEALKELVNRLQGPQSIELHLVVDNDLPFIRKELEVVIYRIVQEFIQNSLKHSKASNIYIDLLTRKTQLILRLEDDGVGFDKKLMEDAAGRGLRNMSTRIRAFNGQYSLKTSQGKGVKLSISFNLATN